MYPLETYIAILVYLLYSLVSNERNQSFGERTDQDHGKYLKSDERDGRDSTRHHRKLV